MSGQTNDTIAGFTPRNTYSVSCWDYNAWNVHCWNGRV